MDESPPSRPEVRIRQASPGDLDATLPLSVEIQQLHVERAPWRYRPVDAEPMAAWMRARIAEGHVWLAFVDDRLAGLLYALPEDRPETPFTPAARLLLVDQLTVLGPFRRLGIGNALMDHAEDLAWQLGCERVELNVLAANEEAVAFYEARGYAAVIHRMVRHLGAD